MAPTSQAGNGVSNGILGSLFLIVGLAVSKTVRIDYKTLLKICITVIGIMAGWAITHWVSFSERLADTQTVILNSQVAMAKDMGDMKLSNADHRLKVNNELAAFKKCMDDHIAEYNSKKK